MNPLPLTGEAFRHAVNNRPPAREALIDDLMYTRTATMIAADPAAGKSTIATQLVLQLSSAEPVFGFFNVPQPRNVYYLQLEGSFDETLERIGYMQDAVNIDYDRLCWDTPTVLNCMDPMSVLETVQRIGSWDRVPDVVVVDPIYMAVAGDLKGGDVSSALVQFSERLKRTFGCSVILIHHTHRERYGSDGNRINENDPYYGSQWLKAHIDVGYHLKALEGHTGVELVCKKSRGGEVQKHIVLNYDPATFTVRTNTERSSLSATDLVLNHLRRCSRLGQQTDFYATLTETRLSQASLRRIQQQLTQDGILRVVAGEGRRRVWQLTEAVPQAASPAQALRHQQSA